MNQVGQINGKQLLLFLKRNTPNPKLLGMESCDETIWGYNGWFHSLHKECFHHFHKCNFQML